MAPLYLQPASRFPALRPDLANPKTSMPAIGQPSALEVEMT
ncbi:hypothetical protein [Streptomyces syringium]